MRGSGCDHIDKNFTNFKHDEKITHQTLSGVSSSETHFLVLHHVDADYDVLEDVEEMEYAFFEGDGRAVERVEREVERVEREVEGGERKVVRGFVKAAKSPI